MEEKLRWAFSLYDINGDGYITREEMTDIVSSVYDLMGKLAEPCIDDDTIKEKVDRIFQVKYRISNPLTGSIVVFVFVVLDILKLLNVNIRFCLFMTDGKITRQGRKL